MGPRDQETFESPEEHHGTESDVAGSADLIVESSLVEDVSIDGMCGVY